MKNKKIAIVGVGSGLGAADKRAQDGPKDIITQISKKYPKIPIFYKFYDDDDDNHDVLERRNKITKILNELYQTIYNLKKEGYFIIVLTGDHTYVLSIQAALAAAAAAAPSAKSKNNTLLYIDAHMDAHTPRSSQSKNPHGMPNSTILGYGGYKEWSCYMGSIKPQNFHLFGVRSFETYEDKILHKIGAGKNIHYMKDYEILRREAPKDVAKTKFCGDAQHCSKMNVVGSMEEHLMKAANESERYSLSIDIDAFDPKFMPGTGYREPNGIHPREILNFLNFAGKDKKCDLIEITEYNPHKDINKKTLQWIMCFIDNILDK